MRVLITGITGFIGSSVVKHLASSGKYIIFALVRPNSNLHPLKPIDDSVSIIQYDTTAESIEQAVKWAQPDVVVHIAALTLLSHHPNQVRELIEANITFGSLLVDVMVRNGVRALVNTGTFWEHMDATDDYRPINLYAATKRAFEDILKYYEDAEDLNLITLKLYGVYGPHDTRSKIFSLFKKNIASGKLLKCSPGEQLMDLVYIDDVVRAYEKAIRYVCSDKECGSATVQIGSGVGLTLRKVAKIYEECAGRPLSLEWGGISYRPREVMNGVADIEAARRILGWKPDFDIKSGIQAMLEQEKTVISDTGKVTRESS